MVEEKDGQAQRVDLDGAGPDCQEPLPLTEPVREELECLRSALVGFLAELDRQTIPCEAGRKFLSFAAVTGVSRWFNAISNATFTSWIAVQRPHLRPLPSSPKFPGYACAPNRVIGNSLAGLLDSLLFAVMWPTGRDDVDHSRKPSGRDLRERFRWGEVVSNDLIETIKAARRNVDHLLVLPAPAKLPSENAGENSSSIAPSPTIAVTPGEVVTGPGRIPSSNPPDQTSEKRLALEAASDLVTLDAAAAIAHISKRVLERHLAAGRLPQPDIRGGGGRAHRWRWSSMRPALHAIVSVQLPERFPSGRILPPS